MSPPAPFVVSYLRVSTDEQGVSGLGLDAQALVISAELDHRGWQLAGSYQDIASGKTTHGRPGLRDAVDAVRKAGGVLVAAKLDRISRDVIDFATLLSAADKQGWSVLVLDLQLDTTTATGRFTAVTMANAAEFERRVIGERTSAALEAKRAAGARLGRPRRTSDDLLRRVRAERDGGQTWQSIADALNEEGLPTARGGRSWQVGTVQGIYRSAVLDELAENRRRLADDVTTLIAAYPELATRIEAESRRLLHAIRAAEVGYLPLTPELQAELQKDALLQLARDEAVNPPPPL